MVEFSREWAKGYVIIMLEPHMHDITVLQKYLMWSLLYHHEVAMKEIRKELHVCT